MALQTLSVLQSSLFYAFYFYLGESSQKRAIQEELVNSRLEVSILNKENKLFFAKRYTTFVYHHCLLNNHSQG